MPGSGTTALKKLLIGLAVLLAALVAVALVVPGFIDWANSRGWIAGRLGDLAGRPVAIDGAVDFAMLPTPRLVAEEVTLSGEQGAALLTAEQLELRILLLPLLLGRVELEHLTLVDPVLRLTRGDGDAAPDETGSEAVETGPDLRLGTVAVENGTAVIADRRLDRTIRLDNITAELFAEGPRGPYRAGGRFTAGPVPVAFDLRSGEIAASGALPLTLQMAAEDGAHRARFAGLVRGSGGWQGDVTAESPDLARLLAIAMSGEGGAEGGFAPPAALSQPVSLRASAQAGPEAIALNGLTVEFGESRSTGSLALSLGRPIEAELALTINRIDVDGWADGGPAPIALAGALWPPPQTGFALPSQIIASADLSVEAIRYNGELVRQLRLQAGLEGGVFEVRRLSAQLPGGSDFGMIGSLSSRNGRPAVDLRAEAGSNDLRGVLSWLDVDLEGVPGGQLRRFAGTLALAGTATDFQLTGLDVTVDNTRLTGGLAYVDRGQPGIGLRFDIDQLNLDGYRAEGDTDWLHDGLAWLEARWPGVLTAFDANIDGRIGRLTLSDVTAGGLHLDATLSGGALTVREASVAELAGGSASLSGRAGRLAAPYALDLRGSAAIPAPTRLAGLFGLDLPDAADRLAPLDLSGRLRLGETENLSLTASVPDGRLELTGGLADDEGEDGGARYSVTARLQHASLPRLVEAGLLGAGPADPTGSLDLYARLVGTPESFEIATLQGMAGPLTLAADGRVTLSGPRPYIEGALRTGAIPLDALLPAAWQRRPDGRWPAAPLDLSVLEAFEADLTLNARSVTLGPYAVADPAATLRLADGTLAIERLTGDLFGGRLGLSGSLSEGETPAAALAFDLAGADAGRVLSAAVGAEGVFGSVDVGFEGGSRGVSLAGLADNMAGDGLVAVRDGRLSGLDLAAVAEAIDAPGSALSFLQTLRSALESGETRFAALNAPFVMRDGVAETESLRLVGDPGVGEGEAEYDPLGDRFSAELGFSFYAHPDAPPIRLIWQGRPESPVFQYEADVLQGYVLDRLSAAQAP